jgi:MoaA/NifB/PqqE/SkfB family radical SAM enzyme
MCGHWKREENHLDPEVLERFLWIGKQMGLETVGYSGGDPFAYPNFNYIMRWHVENDVDFGVVTSGYLPSTINLDLLGKARWVRCSLDAVTPEVYKRVRGGVPVEKVRKSIEKMIAWDIKIGIGITFHKANISDLVNVLHWAKETGVSQVRVWPIRAHSKMDLDEVEIERLVWSLRNYSQIYSVREIDNNFNTTIQAIENKEYRDLDFNKCYVVLYQLFIDAKGDIYHCCTTAGDTESNSRLQPFGNIHRVTGEEYWGINIASRINKFANIRRKDLPKVCKEECILRHAIANNIADTEWERKCFQ